MTQTTNRQLIIDRCKKSRSMIGKMCSEGRPPKMRIPADHTEDNEDIFICDTLEMCEAWLGDSPDED
jgi:hypothetical protein